ncbi:MAG: hypothetical protein L0206_25220 [Actinobacteria bacterium]|nr:hypothetical protein [Actinomycetota bacterium]
MRFSSPPAPIVSILLLSADLARAHLAVDLGGGVLVPFDDEQRDTYGTAPVLTLGVAAGLGGERTWAFLDVGFVPDSGGEFSPDPTFENDEAETRLVPITLGVRTDFVPPTLESRASCYGGIAWQTILTRWESPFGDAESTPTFGLVFELRPEVRVASRYSVWLRQRVAFLGNAEYDLARDLNYSSSTLEAGLSWRSELP